MARRYAQTDKAGSHPFQDDGVDVPTVDNESPTAPAYTPQGFEQNQTSRGKLVLSLAIFGLAVFCAILALVKLYGFPPLELVILACSTSLPAFFLGRSDLKAMRAGVMKRENVFSTRAGVWLGGLVSLVALGVSLMNLVVFFLAPIWSWL